MKLDRLTNAGGYAKNSIMVILDRAKKFKTGALVNVALRYMQFHKKNVLVIDLDGGESSGRDVELRPAHLLCNRLARKKFPGGGPKPHRYCCR